MKKYYYDPTKYKTYLDQLGIKYPTVRDRRTSSPQQEKELDEACSCIGDGDAGVVLRAAR